MINPDYGARLDLPAIEKLIKTLSLLRTTLNTPFVPKGLEQDHKEGGDIELY